MARFFHLLYYYLLTILVLFVVYMTMVLALSPKNDDQDRGFVVCTKQLVVDVSYCKRGSFICPLRHLLYDMKCNTEVILEGFGAWVRGRQSTPWANYLYKPETVYDDVEYEGDIVADMADLEAQSQFIKHKKRELEDAKNRRLNLREDVLMSAPEEIHHNDVKNDILQEPAENEVEKGDISEEAFIEETEEKNKDE